MVCFPNAKINLGLFITEKRNDGFHNLETVFYPTQLSDVLEVVVNENGNASPINITTTGIAIDGDEKNNLCVKAYHLIKNDYQLPSINVHLHKHIPIGAGLGGGSSDAAFFIKLLNEKFELGLSFGELHHYARQLGSDCSFFINNKPSLALEKGDVLESIGLDLRNYYLVLIYPNIHISTAEAYSGIKPKKKNISLENLILQNNIESWKDLVANDFEDAIFLKYPLLKEIKIKLYELGALYVSMSGSGSSMYGIFKESIILPEKFNTYFTWQEKML